MSKLVKIISKIVLIMILTSLICFSQSASKEEAKKPQQQKAGVSKNPKKFNAVPSIIAERTKAEDRVRQIKRNEKSLDKDTIATARKMYTDTVFAKFSGFSGNIALQIRQGKKIEELPQEDQDLLDEAIKNNLKFCNDVDDKLSREKNGNLSAGDVTKVAKEVIDFITFMKNKKKDTAASQFEAATKWKSWDEISVE